MGSECESESVRDRGAGEFAISVVGWGIINGWRDKS